MAKAVFTTKVDPAYDDLPEQRYHFPRTYLGVARGALKDWIVYYEPRRTSADLSSSGGRQSYFATALLEDIQPDPHLANHYYAYVKDYLEFDRPVPFREGDHYYESKLRKGDGSTNKGQFGRAVRLLREGEYSLILAAGFEPKTDDQEGGQLVHEGDSGDEQLLRDRPFVQQVSYRPFRDQVFAKGVKRAYNNTCAISGLQILNGRGRAEAQAAHIRPVKDAGPDSVRNGLALSATVHWMFDRGLISIKDDYTLLLNKASIPNRARGLINPQRRLRLPAQSRDYPHRRFLRYHRRHVFKG
ncbi:MAG: HNH endonuclease [Gammaproteobacteria bacterium]|nr:HNH endonuclease [Gammaproteobacteria bacterium]